jgi:putative transposase
VHHSNGHHSDSGRHHSDCRSRYESITYTERLAEACIDPSVGSVGDSDDNVLAETVTGQCKIEMIHASGPPARHPLARHRGGRVHHLEWVEWFDTRRLLELIGNTPPAEVEAHHFAGMEPTAVAS